MIELRGVGKDFGGIRALHDVSLRVGRGECHALLGENGAGKSTLGRILAGIHAPDRGALFLDGVRRDFRSPRDALAAGIAMVHQELAGVPQMSVAENLALGRWPRRGPLVDRRAMEARARGLLARVGGAGIDVRAPLGSLSTAQEQLVQIAAAVGSGARVLVFDEPTSSLAEAEARALFALIRELRAGGATILYVSHRLPEVFALCERLTVLRDGQLVATRDADATDADGIVRLMIGRELPAAAARGGPEDEAHAAVPGAPRELLRVERFSSPGKFADVSFTLRAGEIVGLAGLVGAGRSEVAAALFGLDPAARGVVVVEGRELPRHAARHADPRRAIDAGLALIPEDRKRQGLVLGMGARMNWSLPLLARLRRRGLLRGLLDRRAERAGAAAALQPLDVKLPSLDAPVAQLSGGNQQKVVLARWLSTGARVLLADEPTRGVDVGAKAQIHDLLRRHADGGAAVLLISSELPELLALADRVLVLRAGRLVAELPRAAANEEALLRAMAGLGAATTVPASAASRRA